MKTIAHVVLATFLFTAWNFISWTVLPLHSNSLKNLPNDAIEELTMHRELPTGVYHYPGLPADNSKDSWNAIAEKLRTGPRITIMVHRREGSSLFEFQSLAMAILFNLITSILLTILVTREKKTHSNSLQLILTSGLIVCFSKALPFLMWFKFPFDFIVADLLDTLVPFSLVAFLFYLLQKTRISLHS